MTVTERGEARELALPYTARARMAPLLVICVFGVCVSLLLLALRPLGVGNLTVTILLVGVWLGVAALLLWLGSYHVDALPDRLRYARLGGGQEMTYEDMREVTLEQMGSLAGQPERPVSLLRLRGTSDERVMLIATRPFHGRDLAILLDAIEQLAPHARLDDSVRALRAPMVTE